MRTGIVLIISLITIVTASHAQESREYLGPIIDMHMHAVPSRPVLSNGEPLPLPCFPEHCSIQPRGGNTGEEIRLGHLAMMESHNIVFGMLSARGNEDALSWAKASPDRYRVGYGFYCPSDLDIENLEQLLDSGQMQFIGEVGTQYCGFPVDDPSLSELFDLAAERDLAVQLHAHGGFYPPTAELNGNVARLEHGRPTHIEELVIRHPGLRIYFEDAGFPFLDDTVALMRQHSEVYADLANITWMISRDVFHHYLESLMSYGLGEQLMFSTDANFHWEGIPRAIDAIETAEFLSAEEKADIFYNNAARFLRLSEEEIARHHAR